jgi:hypothetical protein
LTKMGNIFQTMMICWIKTNGYKLEQLLKNPRDCYKEIARSLALGIKPMFIKDDLACGKVISEWGSPYHCVTRRTPSPKFPAAMCAGRWEQLVLAPPAWCP